MTTADKIARAIDLLELASDGYLFVASPETRTGEARELLIEAAREAMALEGKGEPPLRVCPVSAAHEKELRRRLYPLDPGWRRPEEK